MSEWIKTEDYLPTYETIVECLGNPTICCEEDMDEEGVHRCIYVRKLSSWKIKNGKRINEMWYDLWQCVDLKDHFMCSVKGWKYKDE